MWRATIPWEPCNGCADDIKAIMSFVRASVEAETSCRQPTLAAPSHRADRGGAGIRSGFGLQADFDLEDGRALLTRVLDVIDEVEYKRRADPTARARATWLWRYPTAPRARYWWYELPSGVLPRFVRITFLAQ
jgi:hypothetical protein